MNRYSALFLTTAIAVLASPIFAQSSPSNKCIADLQSGDPAIQIAGAECLGKEKEKTGIDPLIEVLSNTDHKEVAVSAAAALAAINEPASTVEGLIGALDSNSDPVIQYGIVAALTALTTDENRADVQSALDAVESSTSDELLKDLAVKARTLISGS